MSGVFRLLIAGLLVSACASSSSPPPAVVTYTQVVPENPIPIPTAGALAPGTYSQGPYLGARQIIFTLPAGWATSNGLVYKHLNQHGEVAFSAWTVDQVYADPCHWQRSALSPLDLANHSHASNGAIELAPYQGGLANQALRGPFPRALTQVTFASVWGGEVGRVMALRIDLSVPDDLNISTCDKGQFRSWTVWESADGANSHNAPGQLDSVYMVDVDRRPLVIDASHMPASTQADLAELKAILASMIIDR